MSSFSQLAQVCEAVSATKKKLAHRQVIGEYLQALPPDEIPIAARLLIGRVFAENDPRTLNLSGSALGRALEQVAGPLEEGTTEGAVDFGQVVEKWLSARGHRAAGEPLQLREVYEAYAEMASDIGTGSRGRKDRLLLELLRRASPLEAKYIVKHLIKEMRTGASEGGLLDALAQVTGMPGAIIRRANQVSGDVGEVALVSLTQGEAGLARMGLRLGVPLKPMLAQSAEDVADAFQKLGAAFALEYKLDGARVQIHKRGNEVQLYSRHLSNITASLPEVAQAAAEQITAREAILEGEVIALGPTGRPRPFQEVMRRFGREREIEKSQREVPVQLYLFDVLMADGEILLDRPNRERWQALERIAGNLARAPRIEPRKVKEGERFLRQAREAGHEGLMAKLLDSPYVPGERGRQWLKIKPVVTLDLVIVAADWGYGRRTGWLSNLHLAARGVETGEYLEVGKTFKGMTDEEFKQITEQLLALKVSQTRGTVWVEPKIVVEVAFNNVQRSPRYASGVALRLARVIHFRPDKGAEEIETVEYLRALLAVEEGK